jgi:multicomponent Na+:H+ antiporter subunit B
VISEASIFNAEALFTMALLTGLAVLTFGIARLRNLFGVVVLASIYSFLMATVLVVLDAVDVAMTEASVGAGVSAVLLLSALHLTKMEEAKPMRSSLLPLFVAGVTGVVLVWGTLDLPEFGDPTQPIHTAGPDYLERTVPETGIPNAVTSTLASYRGFDTLGETTVIFTAGIAVLVLLKRSTRRRNPKPGDDDAV